MFPDEWRGPSGTLHGRCVAAEIPVRAPNFLAGLFIEGGDILLFLVVVQNDQQVIRESRRTSRAEVEVNRQRFNRRFPRNIAFQVKGPQSQIGYVDVNKLSISDGSLRCKTIFAVAATRRTSSVELFGPLDLSAF